MSGGTEKMSSGALEYIKGKLQRFFGKKSGNKSMRAKGLGNQAKGGAKYETGKAQKKVSKH